MRSTKKLIYLSLLTALSLVIYSIENQIPLPISIPGIRLGLANMISLCILVLYGPKEAFSCLLIRVFLGCFITGRVFAIIYSLSGGLISLAVMSLLYTYFKTKLSLYSISVCGSMAHNFTQLTAACLIMSTPKLLLYFPFLLISALITGYFTGIGASFITKHIKTLNTKHFYHS